MGIKLSKYFLIVILAFLLTGCAAINSTDTDLDETEEQEAFTPPSLAPTAARLRFSDLPVPSGFKLIQDKSFIFQTEGVRVALLKYAGRAKVQDLLDFYKEQMILYNWELLNVVEYDRTVLNFERGKQTCIVTIEPRGIKKIITISLAPKATGSIEEKSK